MLGAAAIGGRRSLGDITRSPCPFSPSERRDILVRAFEASPLRQGVVEVLPDDLRVLAVNDAAARLVGISAATLEGRRVGRFDLPPGLVDAWLESCLDAWRQHAPTSFHFDDDTTDPPRRLLFSVAPMADEPGENRWYCTFSVDDVERASAGPASSEDSHFRHLADAAPAMLWASNPRVGTELLQSHLARIHRLRHVPGRGRGLAHHRA